jgi:hypothetical protein
VIAAGLTHFGTGAAGEFLSSPQELEGLARSAPKFLQQNNIQIVLATRPTGLNAGPPRVVAVHSW